jgi:acetyl-CoA acetyltransferase
VSAKNPYLDAQILGVGEADTGVFPDRTTLELQAQAIERALHNADIDLKDVDGVFVSKSGELRPGDAPATQLSEAFGLRPRFIDTTLSGGNAPIIQVARAAAAIGLGLCSYALVVYGSTQASRRLRKVSGWAFDPDSDIVAFEQPTGYRHPVSVHALIAQRHMYEYGTTSEQLAAVAVSDRAWARLNPSAIRRDPLTIADVLSSRIVSSPLHALDCCLVTDGAGAVIVGPATASTTSIRVLGFAERHTHMSLVRAGNLTTSAAVDTGARAFEMSSLNVNDIDVVQLYDAFTNMPIILLEDLGFCGKGDGGPFVASGTTLPGGRLPMNTQGGGLSHSHPGMYGIFLLIEAVRQLRGGCGERQVASVEHVLCHGAGGGGFGSHATMILGHHA